MDAVAERLNGAADWWREPPAALLASLSSSACGLSSQEAARRLAQGSNRLPGPSAARLPQLLWQRLTNPLLLILIAAALISAVTGDTLSSMVVAVVVAMSLVLDLVQEHQAGQAVEALRRTLALRSRVWRDGQPQDMASDDIVPGDVVELGAGDLVPADGIALAATDLFVNQSALTGEAQPAGKRPWQEGDGAVAEPLFASHALLRGSSVVSGRGRMLVSETGARTELGRTAKSLAAEPPPTSFERRSHALGVMLARASMLLVLFVLLVDVLRHRPLLESFVFAVALAVGLTPELLPMIVSVTMARGAMRMASRRVVVKRLAAVQDLGSMDVLCTDKTGTLTEAALTVERAIDADGQTSPRTLQLAFLNSHFGDGLRSALDDSLIAQGRAQAVADVTLWTKLGELPFDFERRRVSVLLREASGACSLIVKGAPEDVLKLCSTVTQADGAAVPLNDERRHRIEGIFQAHSAEGLRLLAVASRHAPAVNHLEVTDEVGFGFVGFVAFADPPKASTAAALASLASLGVRLKIVTGDHEAVTRHLCDTLNWRVDGMLTGAQIAVLDDAALKAAAERCNLFCRVTPEQKNRIVRALKAGGHAVGYIGDGINDAPPLHSADVGISVDSAVDVARQAADLVLQGHDLDVLRQGILEGRRAMINVDKYVLMATSSNFGNMVSMAIASVVLPFLPMLPVQILLNNLLYDVSELAIPLDRVEPQDLQRPLAFGVDDIRRFMWWFGPLSSIFDLIAFWWLADVVHVPAAQFQSTWFMQSMATQVLVIFVIRTSRPWWSDRPAPALVLSSLGVVVLAWVLPFVAPLASLFSLSPPPLPVLGVAAALTAGYLVLAEAAKRRFHAARHARAPLARRLRRAFREHPLTGDKALWQRAGDHRPTPTLKGDTR